MKPVRRLTFKILVIEGLNYCCEYGFWRSVPKRTGAIAAKLGVEDRTVRYHKRAFKDGKLSCEHKEKCLKGKLFD